MPSAETVPEWFGIRRSEPAREATPDRPSTRSMVVRGMVVGAVIVVALRFLLPPVEPFPTTFGCALLAALLTTMLIRTRHRARRS